MQFDMNRKEKNTGKTIVTTHRFLDEAGDTTFLGKGKKLIIGEPGVSLAFGIGMVKINRNLSEVRDEVNELQQQVQGDKYLNIIPSVRRKIGNGGFYFHATDDPPEVRQLMYKYIQALDCSMEMVVARKISGIFMRQHNSKETEFYADVLSHLIKNKLKAGQKFVLNISHRANSTSNRNLENALRKAKGRAIKKYARQHLTSEVVFNIQNHRTEPLLNIADYLCWSVQRVFERGETRYYDFVRDKVSLVVDIYDDKGYRGSKNYYRRDNPLTAKNRIRPPSS